MFTWLFYYLISCKSCLKLNCNRWKAFGVYNRIKQCRYFVLLTFSIQTKISKKLIGRQELDAYDRIFKCKRNVHMRTKCTSGEPAFCNPKIQNVNSKLILSWLIFTFLLIYRSCFSFDNRRRDHNIVGICTEPTQSLVKFRGITMTWVSFKTPYIVLSMQWPAGAYVGSKICNSNIESFRYRRELFITILMPRDAVTESPWYMLNHIFWLRKHITR